MYITLAYQIPVIQILNKMSSTDRDPRPVTWKAKRRGKAFKYTYTNVKDIHEDNVSRSAICNLFGIITDFKEPTLSKGSDFFALVFVYDDSDRTPLKIRLFSIDLSFFPPKIEVGDVIRLHRLKIYKTQNDIILSSVKGWSWVLWKNMDESSILPPEIASSESYTLFSSDRDRVDKLRELHQEVSGSLVDAYNTYLRINEIKHNNYFSLICQVVDFQEFSCKQAIAKVWDGSLPSQQFFKHDDLDHTPTGVSKNIPEEYIVQISVSDNHVNEWRQLNVQMGQFIKFCNLHAWPNPQHPDNKVGWNVSELCLHKGNACARGIELPSAKCDVLDDVYCNIDHVLANVEVVSKPSSSSPPFQLNSCPNPKTENPIIEQKFGLSDTSSDEFLTANDAIQNHSDSDKNTLSQLMAINELLTQSQSFASQSADTGDSPTVLRCMQESLTVITGEGMPVKLTELSRVIKSKVPLHTSKYFRVRVKIQSCTTDEDQYVGHYSPVTGIFFPSSNSGEPIESSEEVKRFVKAWRQVRGIDSLTTTSDVKPQEFSQWDLPTGSQRMSSYICEKDGSSWESMEMDKCVLRKRRHNEEKFTILYLLKTNDCSKEALRKWSLKHDRVIRSIPLSLLTSEHPAVGMQHGVFYYSCPGCAVEPSLPSLKDEAENFIESRISFAMGSPTLVPRFRFLFNISDGSETVENVSLTGESAVEFLYQTSPQSYLGNKAGLAAGVKECIRKLVTEPAVLECIIEKKSRQQTSSNGEPTYVYEIRNTALKP